MKALFALVVLVVIVAAFASSNSERSPATPSLASTSSAYVASPTVDTESMRRRQAAASLTIKNFKWSAEYSVMTASFTFENKSDYDLKDVEVRCVHSAPSGTRIDHNTRTIYEIVPARSTKTIAKFNMGFVHSQAARSGCEVVNAVVAGYKPPPAKPAPKTAGQPQPIKAQ